jgi:hypothetical protein
MFKARFHVWMAPAWQEITSRAAQKSLAVMCPACGRLRSQQIGACPIDEQGRK